MQMDLSLQTSCAKCHKTLPLQRHHTGCEHMWLGHFYKQSRTARYREFHARYYEFRPEDIVLLCKPCHKKIHRLYLKIIRDAIETAGYVKLRDWSWEGAEAIMKVLRVFCRKWLLTK